MTAAERDGVRATSGARYALDGSDEDLRRLLAVAALLEPSTRAALATVDVRPGWRALECGCGPLGALPVLADLVGPAGSVVGVDRVPGTAARARSVVGSLGLGNVEVRVGDLDDPAVDLAGPYDLAFIRCFLMHQRDPVATLRRVAAALRPGGWLVAMEPLPEPAPFSSPRNDDLALAWDFLHRAVWAGGASRTAAQDLPGAVRRAGLDVVTMAGSFQPADAATGFALHAATTAAARDGIVASGAAEPDGVDALIARLGGAGSEPYRWVTSPLCLVVTARATPGAAESGS